MNRFLPAIFALALSGALGSVALADVASPLLLAQSPTSAASNPYNSPIRRANPNSMQGTQPSAPAIRGPNTVPVPRSPTLDNGGIGNRSPQERTAPARPPTFTPNPPPRDSNTR
ncbi:hypothetical protein NTD84_28125 [Pseudomonas sp. 14P_8.1_Bac3]|uniref:hypothetical protein n=1 Tax=Pseudomonas sp. 14P_8.1_Bac3 TaxID=2971621 RepID=UPI0021CA09D3|nr:hypothetical protein [Pseudomonas sp. 14P_8.1_Bac3]MCU1763570.1 hypothetical protein [Pseudomonas sp. 14P_8.1_Bac3]